MDAPWLMPLRAGLHRPARIATVGKLLELGSLVLLVTVVPRALGPELFGLFAVATSVVTLGSASLSLGGPMLMARFVPTVPGAERPSLARALALRCPLRRCSRARLPQPSQPRPSSRPVSPRPAG